MGYFEPEVYPDVEGNIATRYDRPALRLAESENVQDKEPVVARQMFAQLVSVVLLVLFYGGYITQAESTLLGVQADVVVGAIISIIGVVGAIWGRAKAVAPTTAARLAIDNRNLGYDAGKAGKVRPVAILGAVEAPKIA